MMIRQLEQDLGESPSGEALQAGKAVLGDLTFAGEPNVGLLRTVIPVRPDEFYGMSQSDAAKVYLRKIGYAIAFDDLVSALQKGGAKLGGADPKKTLYVSLARNPRKEFVWPSKDHIGLKEFYDRKG